MEMEFEWDPGKRAANRRKHGLDFADAHLVYAGFVLTMPDPRFDYGEQNGRTRIISMRKANAKETRNYQERFEALGGDDGRRH
jgi:uncharacterized DUF497 family protein